MTRPNADRLADWDRAEDVRTLPFWCLDCGYLERFEDDRCTECGGARGVDQ